MFHLIKSERGNNHILYNGYKYAATSKINKDGSQRYGCINSKKAIERCYAAIKLKNNKIVPETIEPKHKHSRFNIEEDSNKLQLDVDINNAQYNYKKRCRDEITPIHKIYTQEIQKVVGKSGFKLDEIFQRIPAFKTVKTAGYTQRWKDSGKLPKCTNDIKIINELRLTTR